VLTRTDELAGTRVTATLERLAERRVSGIMEIDGNPAGIIYLNHGQITFAEASWIPDLSARLLGALRLSAASRELIKGPGADAARRPGRVHFRHQVRRARHAWC
jgi:hypothetical protein